MPGAPEFSLAIELSGSLGLCLSPELALQTPVLLWSVSEPPALPQASQECCPSSFVLAGHSELATAMEMGALGRPAVGSGL